MYLLTAIIRVCDANTTTNDAPSLERSIITFIASMHYRLGINEAIANDTFAITLFAKTADGNSWLFATHY